MRRSVVNILLIFAAIIVFTVALGIGLSRGEFGGTDASATSKIEETNPDYEPWFVPLWTQPGGEIESGLFALQAGIGAGILGFCLGSMRERSRQRERAESGCTD